MFKREYVVTENKLDILMTQHFDELDNIIKNVEHMFNALCQRFSNGAETSRVVLYSDATTKKDNMLRYTVIGNY